MVRSILPENSDLGWLPFAWLVYLGFFLLGPLAHPAIGWLETLFGAAVFLVLYFWGFWLRGKSKLYAMGGLLALATFYAPRNYGSSVFVVYALGFVGELGTAGFCARILIATLGIVAAEAYMMNLKPGFWIPALVFGALVGAMDIHLAQRRLANRRLAIAHDEIERLAKIAERERIGRDLHDLLGHTLSLIVLKSELASKLAEKDPSRAIGEIRDVERISRSALAEVRSAVRGYRAVSLEAEAQHAIEALQSAGITVDSWIDKMDLNASQESVLVLALREAVTNIVRHADATSCRLRLATMPNACVLEIADDGCGGNAPEGFGLTGMRERIEAIGGTLERDTRSGTRILIQLPA